MPQVDVISSYRDDSALDTRRTLGASALLTQPLFNARAFPLYRQVRLERDATRLTATETRRILRTPSHEIETKLGYVDEPELIHRDNLVLL